MINLDDSKANQIARSFHIPAKPETLIVLQQEQRKEYPDMAVIGGVIAADISLSAYVLKTINSPVFGLNRSITDIPQSVMLLGLNNIMQLVTFFKLRDAMARNKACISMERFWDTATETANVMVMLLKMLNLKQPVEDVYSVGLFHDCGIPLMATRYQDYKDFLQLANVTQGRLVTDLEDERYQTNHAVIGYYVGSSWHLPVYTCQMILRHHDPSLLSDHSVDAKVKEIFCLFKLAESILTSYRRFKPANDWQWACEPVFSHLGISEVDYAELQADIVEDLESLV